MGLFNYIRLKIIVSILRLLHVFKEKHPAASPDHVLQIPSRDPKRAIKVHLYLPENSNSPSPVLLNSHGSGFVMPLHGSDDVYCRYVSRNSPFTVLDIKYRLSPEEPFAAPLHDVEDVLKYVQARPKDYDLKRLCISGFSAGANLSLAASSMMLPKDTFRSIVAIYPPADLAGNPGLKAPPDTSGQRIPPFMSRIFDGSYFQDHDPHDPRISPYYAPAENFPQNVLVITPAQDYLCNEGEELAERIKKDGGGKYVRSFRIEGCGHAFDKMASPGSHAETMREMAYESAVEMLMR
ncbi:putative esterase lipase [Phaeomoniella chlamydospora]|uniref:Putative esterase lipase n=1 Tax=Phaeomoniella chlamydospora TaxID=158046 RepID=A0A0G2GHH5_PHACM|nr:putative esterase lipase [Phaeomoniella chlamydospora]